MNSYSYLGWKGSSNNDTVMNFAVSLLPDVPEKYIFKKKNNRIVYRFELAGAEQFAKLNKPHGLYHKLKSYFFPNSYYEFKSAMLLEASGLPVVKASGWCARGSWDLIVTENPGREYVSAWVYARNECPGNPEKRKMFLSALADFTKKYVPANLYHRDFHLGNLLLKESSGKISFVLIDTLGIRKRNGSNLYNSGILRALSVLKGISSSERIQFLIQSGIVSAPSSYETEWGKIVRHLASYDNRKWFGRRFKILKGHSRYSELIRDEKGQKWLIKKEMADSFSGQNLPCEYEKTVLTRKEARKQWLYSCFLQSHGIDHRMPVAWLKQESGKDVLFLERAQNFCKAYGNSETSDFAAICRIAGIFIESVESDILIRNGKPCLASSNPAKYNRNRWFF